MNRMCRTASSSTGRWPMRRSRCFGSDAVNGSLIRATRGFGGNFLAKPPADIDHVAWQIRNS